MKSACRFPLHIFRQGEMQGENASFFRCRFHAYGAALRFQNASGQIKPHAGAFGLFDDRVAAPVETLKDPVGIHRGDTDALVLNFQTDIAVKPVEPQGYRAVCRGIFDRIVQKVCYRLGSPAPVQKHRDAETGFSVGLEQLYGVM